MSAINSVHDFRVESTNFWPEVSARKWASSSGVRSRGKLVWGQTPAGALEQLFEVDDRVFVAVKNIEFEDVFQARCRQPSRYLMSQASGVGFS